MHPRREAFDRWLVAKARQRKLPLLGIGAGAQTLNVVLGGTLSYHIPADYPRAIPHAEPADPYHGHMVMLREGSLLAHVYPAGLVAYVRSQHHQAVDDVAPGLCATAWDAANIVEAIESRIPGWPALGVQWHPEFTTASETDRILFVKFVDLAAQWRRKRSNPHSAD
jgi:putative glutamine amidotransferase